MDFQQVGLGTQSGSIISNQQEGSLQTTNLPTDFAIQGDGFFIVSDGQAQHYTRDSNFIVDGFGNVNSAASGDHLQGYGLKQVGNNVQVDTSKVVNLTVPQQINPAQQTNVLDLFGNLDSSTTTAQTQSVGVYDSLGQLHNVVVSFAPPTAAGGNWTVTATSNDLATGAGITVTGGNVSGTAGAVHFNALGQLDNVVTPLMLTFSDATGGTAKPPEPWDIPSTTTATNAMQSAVQLNISDTAVGAMTAFASPTTLATQATPGALALLGSPTNSTAIINGNLSSGLGAVTTATLTFAAADSNGYTHTFVVTMTSDATGATWTPSAAVSTDGITTPGVTSSVTPITWTSGVVATGGTATITIPAGAFDTSASGFASTDVNAAQTLTLDLSKLTNTTLGYGLIPPSTGSSGNSAGSLKDFSVDNNGMLHGVYTNGFTQTIGQILLANFENPGGLQSLGNNLFDTSANSGVVNVGTPGSGRFGTIAQGNVETSNVDLATEFSNMILAERGFQANSRIITTSDQMLQDVVALKQ
jgi:flagellar hook protein FlgE